MLDVKNVVKEFLTASPRPNPFTDNLPGTKWVNGFMNRHPKIAQRTAEPITEASSKVSETDIQIVVYKNT